MLKETGKQPPRGAVLGLTRFEFVALATGALCLAAALPAYKIVDTRTGTHAPQSSAKAPTNTLTTPTLVSPATAVPPPSVANQTQRTPTSEPTLTPNRVQQIIAFLQKLTTDAPANQPLAAPAGAGPGEVLFYQDCTVCHGADGAGDKKVSGATSADLRWAKLSDKYHNDVGLISRAILEGKDQAGKDLHPAMPRWKDTLTPDQVQQLIAFLQTLK